MKVGIHIDRSVEEIEVLITAQERNRKVDALYQHIVEFDKSRLETLTAYRDDIAKIVNVADIFRIYTGNQKVYIQTHQGEYVIRYRLYELNEALDKKQFLRISNSEIVNVKKIRDIDLSIIVFPMHKNAMLPISSLRMKKRIFRFGVAGLSRLILIALE